MPDSERPSGSIYTRLLKGEDEASTNRDVRRDDPRIEATENTMARLAGWHHLWAGFAPDEPFPFSTDQFRALAGQLSESVLVASGAAAIELMARLSGDPNPLKQYVAGSQEEKEMLPHTKSILGIAYSYALAEVLQEEGINEG